MDITQDSSIDPRIFGEKSQEFFELNNVRIFSSPHEAVGMITAADDLVDVYLKQLEDAGSVYSGELILQFGSALGEALRMIFTGEWIFSKKQNRWVVSYTSPLGSTLEVNIFHKVKKRFDNGMEDSIGYQFEIMRQSYLSEAKSLDSKSSN